MLELLMPLKKLMIQVEYVQLGSEKPQIPIIVHLSGMVRR